VTRLANLVYPGADQPHGPLQRKLSEIFDTDVPPFYKNFLRVEVENGKLTIQGIGVRGDEQSAAALEMIGPPVRIDLPDPTPPAGGRA
jgi:hypothetical protein